MFELTGQVGKKNFTETQVSAQQLINDFKLTLPEGDIVVFKLGPQYIKKDNLNNMTRHLIGINMKPFIAGTFDGGSVNLRFFDQKIPKGQGMFKYTPSRVRAIRGIETILRKDRDMELIVFLLLYKGCDQSPLRRPGEMVEYELFDSEKASLKELEFYETKHAMQEEIMKASDQRIKNKVKGITIKSYKIPHTSTDTISSMRSRLMQALDMHGKDFISAWNDTGQELKGFIADCFDKGIVVVEPTGNGQIIKWGKDHYQGQQILSVGRNKTPQDALMQFAYDNYESFMRMINKAMTEDKFSNYALPESASADMDVPVPIELKDVEELTPDEITKLIIDNDFVYFDRKSNEIFWMLNNAPEKKPVLKVENPKHWRVELSKAITEDKDIWKRAKNRIASQKVKPVNV